MKDKWIGTRIEATAGGNDQGVMTGDMEDQ